MDGKNGNVSIERHKGGNEFLVVARFSKTGTSRRKYLCSFSSSPYKYINQRLNSIWSNSPMKDITYLPMTDMWPKPIIVQNFFVVTSHMYIPENKTDGIFEGGRYVKIVNLIEKHF